MVLWSSALAILLLLLIAPIFLAKDRAARGRLLGIFVGLYIAAAGFALTCLAFYSSAHGVIAFGRRGRSAVLFSESPLIFLLLVGVFLAGPALITLFGWRIFRASQRGELGP
jgi:hypothetical protein